MKFLSVTFFVVFAYVPVTYSYNAGPTTWKPIDAQNRYLNSNIQNGYQSNGPALQPVKDPVNIPIPNPTASYDINRSQPSPNQYVNQIRPRIPYQIPQNVPVTQNTIQQTNLQYKNAPTLPLSAPTVNYSPPNINLKAIYEAAKPTKQYTIVHLNGTVEQTDDLQAIAARHPNFVMLNAADVLANKYSPVQNVRIPQSITPVQAAPIPVQKPAVSVQQAITPNQNIGWSKNSYQGVYNQQAVPNLQAASLVSNPSSVYQSSSTIKPMQPAVGATVVPISATPSFQQPIPLTKQPIQRNPTNVYSGGTNSQLIQQSNGPVLPTIPNTVPQQTTIPNYNWRSRTQVNITPNQQNGNPQNLYNQNPINQVISQSVSGDFTKNSVAGNPSAFYAPVQPQSTPNIPSTVSYGSPNILQGKYNNPSSTKTSRANAVAASPLPIYPETSVPNVAKSAISNEPVAAGAAVVQPVFVPVQQPITLPNNTQNIILKPQIIKDKNDAIKALNSNFSIPYIDVQNRSSTINLPVSAKSIAQISPNIVEHPTLPILLPKEPPQNTLPETEPPTLIQEPQQIGVTPDKNVVNIVKPPIEIIPIENKTAEPITKNITSVASIVLEPISKNIVDTSTPNKTLNVTATDAQPVSNTNVVVNNTNSPDIEVINKPKIEPDNSNSTLRSVPKESPTVSSPEKPWSLLSLSDDGIWDLVRNNTQNVFFFFMPPRPKITKESKTIMFANGTTVEEVTETVVDVGSDGEPKVTITTKKSYN